MTGWDRIEKEGPVTVVAIGAGARSRTYCKYAQRFPDRMKVVAVAEPDEQRRAAFAAEHQIPANRQFASFEQLAALPRFADAAVNGTMDRVHYASSMPLIERGYHLLLEKPISPREREVLDLIDAAQRHRRLVMICHVLRYAPFYQQIHALVRDGSLGSIIAMHLREHVSYHHMAVGFVRGRWNREDRSSPIMLAKCCHDLDIIAWLLSGVAVRQVASFGSLTQFRPEHAPAGSTMRCLDGCAVERTCQYSAVRNYIEQGFGWGYPFEMAPPGTVLSDEQKLELLRRADNPYGRCVWRCDNDVADHQTVLIQFDGGVTATLDLLGATARPTRTIQILGSTGELEGDFETGVIRVRTPELARGSGYHERTIDTKAGGGGQGGHGGGDRGLVGDFVAAILGESGSAASTRIEDSLTGHRIAFAADVAMRERRVVAISPPR